MHATLAREAVILFGIVEDRHLGMRVESGMNGGLRLGGHKFVLARHMQNQRGGNFFGLVKHVLNADAVIADIGVRVSAGGREVGHLATQTKAQRADLAGA